MPEFINVIKSLEIAKFFLTSSLVAFARLLSYNVKSCSKIHFNK